MDKRPFSVKQFAALMKERGDPRSLEALEKFIIRIIPQAFPGAFKTNPKALTSPFNIPYDEAMAWMDKKEEPTEDAAGQQNTKGE